MLQWSSVVICTLAGLWHTNMKPQPSESALWKLLSKQESWGEFISEDPDTFLPKWQSKANRSHVQTVLVRLANSWFPSPGKVLPCQSSSSCLSVLLLKTVFLRVCKPEVDFFPLKYVTTEKSDTSTFYVLPCNFLLEGFLCYLSESCLSPHLTACLSGGSTRVTNKTVLERHFNWTSRYRNKQALESFSWLLVSLMPSTLSQCKVLWGDSPTSCNISFQKRNPSSNSFRNSHLLPSPVGYCRSWFTLQGKFLQMSRCFKGSQSQR